jgi:hypothetical protein
MKYYETTHVVLHSECGQWEDEERVQRRKNRRRGERDLITLMSTPMSKSLEAR